MVPVTIRTLRRSVSSVLSDVRRNKLVKVADMLVKVTPQGTYVRPMQVPKTQTPQEGTSGYIAVWL